MVHATMELVLKLAESQLGQWQRVPVDAVERTPSTSDRVHATKVHVRVRCARDGDE